MWNSKNKTNDYKKQKQLTGLEKQVVTKGDKEVGRADR